MIDQPDLVMPSVVPDGPDGAHFYRRATVLRLLDDERERFLAELADACIAAEIPDSKYESLLIALRG